MGIIIYFDRSLPGMVDTSYVMRAFEPPGVASELPRCAEELEDLPLAPRFEPLSPCSAPLRAMARLALLGLAAAWPMESHRSFQGSQLQEELASVGAAVLRGCEMMLGG